MFGIQVFFLCVCVCGAEEYHFREMVSSAIANMLGGIGYFYGSTIVRSTADPKMQSQSGLTGPLLTAVPSRPFFPRGFLWDEGFHQVGAWSFAALFCIHSVHPLLQVVCFDLFFLSLSLLTSRSAIDTEMG